MDGQQTDFTIQTRVFVRRWAAHRRRSRDCRRACAIADPNDAGRLVEILFRHGEQSWAIKSSDEISSRAWES
jgi:hypothetical protein